MIPIKTTKSGYKIFYDPDTTKFVAKDSKDEEIYKADKQKEVEDYLKKLEKRKFQKIRAIHKHSRRADIGSITSIRKEDSRYSGFYLECWFVKEEDKSRGKHRLEGYFFKATPENIALAEKIIILNEQIHKKYAHIERLQQKFKEAITDKNVLALAGVEA